MTQSNVRAAFERHFNTHGTLYASAGRINLIGEHTDYNGGFVFPGAVDCGITAMIRPNGTDRVRAYAVDLDSYAEFGLREEDKPAESWARYIFGVCREIQKRGGRIGGFDTAFSGDVPLGAGMSSSAALESTFAFALNDLYALGIDKFELARIGQSTEHNYCGVKCGIMDQFASVFGKKGCLMRLDCRSMEFEYFPFDPVGYKLVLLDTVVKHELVGSPYNRRRESCERVAKMLEEADVRKLYAGYYATAPFTHVTERGVDLKQVVNTNKALLQVARHGDKLHVVSAIDNLLKGASGQAVENMNLLFGLVEREGLRLKASAF